MARTTRVDSPQEIGRRLRLIRLAYSAVQQHVQEMSQAEFARRVGLTAPAWNNAERGYARIGLGGAIAVCTLTGVTLDYIFRGLRQYLPYQIGVEIDRLERDPKLRQRA